MTDIIEDNVDVTLQIGTTSDGYSAGGTDAGVSSFNTDTGIFWDAIELEVEITQTAMPNYVKGKVIPQPQYSETLNEFLNPSIGETDAADDATESGLYPNNGISKLVGSRFRLEVDNGFVAVEGNRAKSNTVSDKEEDSLLFDGRLANISPIGTNVYEIIAYDPGQQAFNIGEESGSVINQKLELGASGVEGFRDPEDSKDNNEGGSQEVLANTIVTQIVKAAGINKFKINITDKNNNPKDIYIQFDKSVVPVKDALNKIRDETNSEWWFDKDGTFYFGNPRYLGSGIEKYDVSLIKDTTAGITTPPYQSVRVIGSGVATKEGWAGNNKIEDINQAIVKEVNIGQPSSGGSQAELVLELDPDSLNEPVYKYINAELSTAELVQNTALKIANELIKQQASGKVTVIGFPEVQPFDGISMPNSPDQPMGGQIYEVYAVRHKINNSDGFLTEIEVAGPTQKLRREIEVGTEGDRNIIATSLDRDVYTPDGEKRAFKPGAGEGEGTTLYESEKNTALRETLEDLE